MAVNVNGGALEFDAVINASQFNAAISSIEKQLAGLTKSAEKEATAIDNVVKRAAQGIAAYASFAAATNFVTDIVKVRGEFQQLEVAFSTMLGSKQKADKLMAEVTQFAATTPFELQDVAAATKQLLAFGVSADDIIPTLRSLGDVSAGIGAPVGEIAYLFGTIKTAGKAMTVDIRQFAQRGIPIYEELAKVLNVNQSELNGFIEAGKVGFPEIEQVFKNLTAEGSKFGGLMEAQSQTLTGQISNLKDAWNQMLNTIGKGQEGLFADAISGATYLVKNFESVLDILKILVITYGSYKAAVIATTAVQAIATAVTKGYTIAETLRYQAMLISERVMKLLNRTMLANPAVALATGFGLLISALAIFGKRATEAKSKAELLADAQAKVGDRLAETEAKIRPYLEALKNANLSEQDRVSIYEKLKAIDPEIIKGLNAKTLSYETLAANVNVYLGALRKQIALESNKEALTASIKQEQVIQKKIELAKKKQQQAEINAQKATDKESKGLAQFSATEKGTDIKVLEANLKEQRKITEELGTEQVNTEVKTQQAKARTLSVIEDEIKAEKEKQSQFSTSSKEYNTYQQKINALEAEKKRITGAAKENVKAANVEENKTLALLEKRKDLLQQIEDVKRGAKQSGLIKEQSELDKINEKYDALIQNVDDYNKKVDDFNKKNKGAKVQKVGQADIVEINKARTQELTNSNLKKEAEDYKKHLEDQRDIFAQFEDAKKEVGIAKAKEMFAAQTGNYENFLQLLNDEAAKLAPKIALGIANVGEVKKFQSIIDQTQEYNKKKAEEALEIEKANFNELIEATVSFSEEKLAINKKYDDLEATLNKNSNLADYENRKAILKQGRADELQDLQNNLIRSSELYRQLNQDIIGFTRDRIKEEIKILKEKLKADASLTPEIKANIQSTIDRYNGLLDETNETAKKYEQLAGSLGEISGIFGDLAGSLEGLNDGLADTLSTLGEIVGIAGQAAGAIASFASGDIIGGIAKTVKVITGIFSIGKKSRESERKAQQEVAEFNNRILLGEQEITQEVRNRQREQVKLNKLKLEGLNAEKKLLDQQKKAVQEQYNSIFSKLQNESFISAETTKKYGGFLGVGRKTKVVEITQSLAGRSFDDLEKLFAQGQLTGRAKELFEMLQKIKQEGVDIDAQLAQNAEEAKQIFTGTTAEGISDSIVDGFKNGLNSASDFAGTFEDLMRNAMIQSLKFKYLEAPLKDFFDQFAAASESEGQLTSAEIDNLRSTFGGIINNANQQFDQLQQIAGLNFGSSGTAAGNSLTGAIKGITESQAELLAGQFGGLRITAIESLSVSRNQLSALNMIQINTSLNVVKMAALLTKFDAYETGLQRLHVKI